MTMRLGNPAAPSTGRWLGWCLVAVLVVLAVPSFAFAAAFPFIDVNNNGRWDRGIDSGDITPQIISEGGVTTPYSIVIPGDRTELVASNRRGLVLVAGQNITIKRNVRASTLGAGITLVAQQGTITIGSGVYMRAPGELSFEAGKNVVFGADSLVTSRPMYGEHSTVIAHAGGDVLVMHGAVLMANHEVQLVASQGSFTSERGTGLIANKGNVQAYGAQKVSVSDSVLKGMQITLATDGDMLELRGSQVMAVTGGSVGLYLLTGDGGTVDMKGTVCYGLDANDIVIDAANVIK